MRIPKSILAVAILISISIYGMAVAQDPIPVNVISAPFGTASYVFATTLEEISKKANSTVVVTASETPGIIYNIKIMEMKPEMKKKSIMTYSNGSGWMAANGVAPFEMKYQYPKLIANYALTCLWLATLNADISGPDQLIGKKVALGRAAQPVWGKEPAWLLEHGWGIFDKVDVQYVGTKPAIAAMMDGLVDASIVGGFVDPISGVTVLGPTTVELMASGRKVYNLPWGREAVDKLISTGIPLAHVTIPANTLEGQTEPLEVASDPISWVAYPDLPEDVAYAITKLIIKNVDKFKEYHSLGKLLTKEALVYNWKAEDIHPGALKAYKEAGIL